MLGPHDTPPSSPPPSNSENLKYIIDIVCRKRLQSTNNRYGTNKRMSSTTYPKIGTILSAKAGCIVYRLKAEMYERSCND